MSASMKGWVNGVVSQLGEAFDSSTVEIVKGERRDAPWASDRDLICVWWPGWDELSRDTDLAQPTVMFRYFPRRSAQPEAATPADPDPILDAADALLDALGRQTQGVGYFTAGLSCRLTTLRPNYDRNAWRVEGTLLAFTRRGGG